MVDPISEEDSSGYWSAVAVNEPSSRFCILHRPLLLPRVDTGIRQEEAVAEETGMAAEAAGAGTTSMAASEAEAIGRRVAGRVAAVLDVSE